MASIVKKISINDFKEDEYVLTVKEVDTVYIQQTGFSFHLQGNIGNTNDWFNLRTISLNDYGLILNITENGLYALDTSGLDYLKIILDENEENAIMLIKVVGELW